MYWNSEGPAEKDGPLKEIDYANPLYYQQSVPTTPYAAGNERTFTPESDSPYADPVYSPVDESMYTQPTMTAYSGPAGVEGYTTDVGAEQDRKSVV